MQHDEQPTETPAAQLHGTPAAAFGRRRTDHYIREISPGWRVVLRKLNLTGELIRGTLPNPILEWVLWEDADRDSDANPKTLYKQKYSAYQYIAARALVSPRLVLPEELERRASTEEPNPQPHYEHGEIGVDDLNYIELYNIWFYAVKEAAPPAQAAPFPDGADHAGATSAAP